MLEQVQEKEANKQIEVTFEGSKGAKPGKEKIVAKVRNHVLHFLLDINHSLSPKTRWIEIK